MNKLVIVGNGFDLAHGLPTSYNHFINYFWKNLHLKYKDPLFEKMININEGYSSILDSKLKPIECFEDFKTHLKYQSNISGDKITERTYEFFMKHKSGHNIFEFKNLFFQIISFSSIKNWVEIENIYYNILKNLIKQNPSSIYDYPNDIKRLNIEFDEIKELLENYLQTEISNKNDFTRFQGLDNEILNLFRLKVYDLEQNSEHQIFYEFPKKDHEELIEFDKILKKLNPEQRKKRQYIDPINWPNCIFLDFNYTDTVKSYVDKINSENDIDVFHVQIHGKINCVDNKINFGFGDEMDEDYRIIERKNDNSYLENIKSFKYLHNSNYRKLLNWIESEKFQVYIFGHSCGLSDRTLLNTIFENENCRSIKIFYYIDELQDNFTQLTQNISRHFNKKVLMRAKIVDKSLSVPLTQNIRFKEK